MGMEKKAKGIKSPTPPIARLELRRRSAKKARQKKREVKS